MRRLPLTLRVPLLAAALMILAGSVASQQVLSALGRVQDARLRELAQMHVEGLSVALGPLVLRRDVWEIYDTLDRASRASEGRRMVLTAVADDAGRVLAATDPRRAPLDSAIDALTGGAQTLETLSVGTDAAQVRLAAPLVYQDRPVGWIATELDVTDLVAERRRAALLLLLGNAAVTLVLAAGGYLAVRRMLHPVASLARHMSDTAGAPQPIPAEHLPAGDTEVARLARTFNAMAEAVAARAEAERRLAERERFVSLGRLSSSLAHEINNPLGGLLNAADTIRRFADRPDVVRQSAELLERGLKHLRNVVRATLEQNRLDRSGEILRPEDLDDLRFLIAPEAARQGQDLRWSVAAGAAAMAAHGAGELRQIALNLLLNASAAAGPGGAIGFSLLQTDGGLDLEVSDDGAGLPPEALKRLLTSDVAPGSGGVGLRLVRDLVGALGGGIDHQRRDGVTRITASLPAAGTRIAAQ